MRDSGNVIVTRDLTEIQCGIRESLLGYGIWPKYRAGFEKRYRDTGFDCYLRSGIRKKWGADVGLGKKKKTILGM